MNYHLLLIIYKYVGFILVVGNIIRGCSVGVVNYQRTDTQKISL